MHPSHRFVTDEQFPEPTMAFSRKTIDQRASALTESRHEFLHGPPEEPSSLIAGVAHGVHAIPPTTFFPLPTQALTNGSEVTDDASVFLRYNDRWRFSFTQIFPSPDSERKLRAEH
jgi:hypothetical protein